MKKLIQILLLIAMSAMTALAGTTTVSGTIQDPTTQIYANGTVMAEFIPDPNNPAINLYTVGGVPISPTTVTGTMNGAGTFSITLIDNTTVSPANSKWRFTVCSKTSAPCVQTTPISISGGAQNVGAFINGFVPNISINANQTPGFSGTTYTDSEVLNPANGTFYFNTTLSSTRIFNGSTWQSMTFAGGTLAAPLIFSPDNTFDIGAVGATRPRNGFFGTGVTSPLFTGNLAGNVTGNITGIFTSSSANSAQSGTVRYASGDSECFRNNANGADICISKNTFDQYVLPFVVLATEYRGNSGSSEPNTGGPFKLAATESIMMRNAANNNNIVIVSNDGSDNIQLCGSIPASCIIGGVIGLKVIIGSPTTTLTTSGATNQLLFTPANLVFTPSNSALYNTGVSANGTGMTHKRITTGSIGATTRVEVLLTWGVGFSDTNYSVTCAVEDSVTAAGTQGLTLERVKTKSTTQVGGIINNPTAGALTGTLDCIAMHD